MRLVVIKLETVFATMLILVLLPHLAQHQGPEMSSRNLLGQLRSPLIAPGYQYDIIRRRRGHLGLSLQFDLFNSNALLFAAAQVNTNNRVISAKKSLLAPIPVAGPQFRFYLTNSPRLFLEGNVYGMYFFGYGNFVSTSDNIGVTVYKHLSLNAGYQLGSRLNVNVDSKRPFG